MKRFTAATALVVAALGVSSCVDEVPETTDTVDTPPAESPEPTVEEPAPAGTTVSVADIVGDGATYNGMTVTVEADVEEVLTPQSFSLDEDAPVAGGIDNDLIVLFPQSAGLSDIDDQWLNNRVRVTGTVRTMAIVDIEREIGWDLDPTIEAELEDMEPVLIAETVERVGTGT